MFGCKRRHAAILSHLTFIMEQNMATQDQLTALTDAVQTIGTSISAVAGRFQALADKLDTLGPDDGEALSKLTDALRQDATQLDAIGTSAQTATVESPPTVTDAPAPVDTTDTAS